MADQKDVQLESSVTLLLFRTIYIVEMLGSKDVWRRTSDGPSFEGVLHDHVGELVERAQHAHQVPTVPQDHLHITHTDRQTDGRESDPEA